LKPSVVEPLYGSAEEFVSAQRKAFHGSPIKDLKKIDFGEGIRSNTFLGKTTKVKSGAIFFTPDENVAKFFAENRTEFLKDLGKVGDPTVYERYLNIKNPIDLTGKNIKQASQLLDKAKIDLEKEILGIEGFGRDLETLLEDKEIELSDLWKIVDKKENVAKLQKIGIDGAIFKETEKRGISYAIFNPNQAFTKQQLIDIYNQAVKGTKEVKEVKKPTLPKRQPPKNIPPKKPAVVKSKTANTEPKKTTLPKPIQKTQSIQPKKPSLPKPKKSDIIKAKETPKTKIIPKTSELKAKKEKEEFTSKVFERMQAENPELLKGDLKATKIYLDNESKKAIKLMEKDKQAAYNLAMGREESSDVLGTSVNIAMTEKALEEGNNELAAKLIKNRSLAQTRRGQELVAEKGSITDNSTSRYVKELLSNRLDKLGDKYTDGIKDVLKKGSKKENAINKIEKEIANVEIAITNKKLDTKTALALLEKMTCI
jgi:RNA binding exosome subunit